MRFKLLLLISLLTAILPFKSFAQISPPNAAGFATEGSIAAASLTTSYANLLVVTNSLVVVDLLNNTDGLVLCTFDGTNNHVTLPAYSAISLDVGAAGKKLINTVKCKYSGSAPTVGTLYATGVY